MHRLPGFLLLGLLAANAFAQQAWPNRPMRLVIPFAPGGGADIAGRLIAQELGEVLKQPMLVENRTGAGGKLAYGSAGTGTETHLAGELFSSTTGTPVEIVNRLNAATVKAVQNPDLRARLTAAGLEPVWSTPAEFAAYVKSETAKWGKIVKESGATSN